MNKNVWEFNYRDGRYNEYPYELIILYLQLQNIIINMKIEKK